jgi:putative oxidoreductase
MLDTRKFGGLFMAVRGWLTGASHVLDLALRLYVANVFFSSGLTKLRDWSSTLLLFQDEYRVPLLRPDVAAVLGTFGELFFPVLLALGLATRFAAFSLACVNIVAVVSYWHVLHELEPALAQHFYWGTLLLVTLLYGPGKLALDNFIWPKALRQAA